MEIDAPKEIRQTVGDAFFDQDKRKYLNGDVDGPSVMFTGSSFMIFNPTTGGLTRVVGFNKACWTFNDVVKAHDSTEKWGTIWR